MALFYRCAPEIKRKHLPARGQRAAPQTQGQPQHAALTVYRTAKATPAQISGILMRAILLQADTVRLQAGVIKQLSHIVRITA